MIVIQSIKNSIYSMDTNPVYVFREEWDSETGFYRPCGESPNWNTREEKNRYYYTFGEYLFERVEQFEEMLYKPLPGLEYITIDQVPSVDRYLYVVSLYEPMYFFLQDKFGLDFLCTQVKQDIRTGKCKLVFLLPFEGYTGVQEMVTKDDFKIIQKWIDEENLPSSNVYYINANLKSHIIALNFDCKVNVSNISMGDTWVNVFNLPDEVPQFIPSDEKYLYTYYSRRPRTHRIFVAADLMRNELFHLGKISFNPLEDYKGHELVKLDPTIIPYVDKLYIMSPIFIDRDNSGDDIALHVPMKDYSSTFIHLVGETLYSNDTLFISEKTWKPISVGVPFITISSPGSLEWLKSQGFKTFDRWFDESYDLELDPFVRFSKITQLIKDFSIKSIDELKSIRNEMREVCEFNKNVMKERTKKLFYYENGEFNQAKVFIEKLIEIYNK